MCARLWFRGTRPVNHGPPLLRTPAAHGPGTPARRFRDADGAHATRPRICSDAENRVPEAGAVTAQTGPRGRVCGATPGRRLCVSPCVTRGSPEARPGSSCCPPPPPWTVPSWARPLPTRHSRTAPPALSLDWLLHSAPRGGSPLPAPRRVPAGPGLTQTEMELEFCPRVSGSPARADAGTQRPKTARRRRDPSPHSPGPPGPQARPVPSSRESRARGLSHL